MLAAAAKSDDIAFMRLYQRSHPDRRTACPKEFAAVDWHEPRCRVRSVPALSGGRGSSTGRQAARRVRIAVAQKKVKGRGNQSDRLIATSGFRAQTIDTYWLGHDPESGSD